jgi:hypothetical protein
MPRLAGKKALITAAGQGIGRASALAFAAEGAEVIATDIDTDSLAGLEREALEQGAGLATRPLDVTDPAAIAAIAGELGALDVLFNCAGLVHHGRSQAEREHRGRNSRKFDTGRVHSYPPCKAEQVVIRRTASCFADRRPRSRRSISWFYLGKKWYGAARRLARQPRGCKNAVRQAFAMRAAGVSR